MGKRHKAEKAWLRQQGRAAAKEARTTANSGRQTAASGGTSQPQSSAAAGEQSARTCCVVLGRGSKRAGQLCGKALPCKRHQGSAQAAASQPPAPRAGGARAGAKRPRGTTPDSAAKQGALHYGAFSPRPGSTLKRRRGGVAAGGDAAEQGRENPFGLFTGEIKHMALPAFRHAGRKVYNGFWPGRRIPKYKFFQNDMAPTVFVTAPLFPMVSQVRCCSPATPRATTAAAPAPRRAAPAPHPRRSHRRLAPNGGKRSPGTAEDSLGTAGDTPGNQKVCRGRVSTWKDPCGGERTVGGAGKRREPGGPRQPRRRGRHGPPHCGHAGLPHRGRRGRRRH